MLYIEGFYLIKTASGQDVEILAVPKGHVDYQPKIKYRIDKTNAFDPTIIIQRDPYHSDQIKCDAFIDADEYDALLAILQNGDKYYIEFNVPGGTFQLPFTINKLPERSNDGRFDKTKVSFSLDCIYVEHTYIDFELIQGYGNGWGECWGF